jgi:hypothetical protein
VKGVKAELLARVRELDAKNPKTPSEAALAADPNEDDGFLEEVGSRLDDEDKADDEDPDSESERCAWTFPAPYERMVFSDDESHAGADLEGACTPPHEGAF